MRPSTAPLESLQLIEDFESHLKELGRARNTVRLYVGDLIDFAETIKMPLWPKPAYFDNLVSGWIKKMRDKGDSVASLRRRLYSLKSFYTFAGIPNVTSKLPIPRLTPYLPDILTSEESAKVLEAAKLIDIDTYLITSIILLTGLRLDEALTLKLTDEQLETGTVSVSEEGRDQRTVKVGKEAYKLLLEFNEQGNRWKNPKTLGSSVFLAATMAGVPHATPHTLRSTCAARMLAAGLPREFISSNMGYKSSYTLDLIRRVIASSSLDEDMVF